MYIRIYLKNYSFYYLLMRRGFMRIIWFRIIRFQSARFSDILYILDLKFVKSWLSEKIFGFFMSYEYSDVGYSLVERDLITLHRSFSTSRMALLKLALPLKRMMRRNLRHVGSLIWRLLISSKFISKDLIFFINNIKFLLS